MELYKTFKKKKNKTIFVLSFSFLIIIILSLYLFFQNHFSKDVSYSLLLVLLVIYLVFIMYYRSILLEVMMKFHYYEMINDNLGLLEPHTTLYTKNWLNFLEQEFLKYYENDKLIFYYKFYRKLPKLGRTGQAFFSVVVSKKENHNFYDDEVNKLIEEAFDNYKDQKRVKKQIMIQFKKYKKYNENSLEELREIINFKNGDFVYINLPVGYFVNEDKVYFLRPKKRYSHKYYYFTCKMAKHLSYVDDGDKDE